MKQIISIVVAMNHQRVIGTHNQLPWNIPEDLAYFKKVTLGKPIIMGRKTFESIGRALPLRRNIVISRSGFSHPDIEVFQNLEDALLATQNEPEIAIIGGGELFKLAVLVANSLHVTTVDYMVEEPTTWFPQLDLSFWKLENTSSLISANGIHCEFNHYILIQRDAI